jgi:predicted chitinase|tara:strand:- start:9074 stop:9394 length:321 start_codon:yes stop_codon:yes gene_type:complete
MTIKKPLGIFPMEYKKLACYFGAKLMNETDNFKSIYKAIEYSNRKLLKIPKAKSANVTSGYQQAFCNAWMNDRGIKHKSKRYVLDLDTLSTDWDELIERGLEELLK